MDFLSADSLPWLKGPQQRLRTALQSGHLPHSLLVLSVPGLGAEQLANWMTALVLCESPGTRPFDVWTYSLASNSDGVRCWRPDATHHARHAFH